MEVHSLLCPKCLVTYVIRDCVEFSGEVLIDYRALQMLFQLPDFVQGPVHCVFGRVLVLPSEKSDYKLAVPENPDWQ